MATKPTSARARRSTKTSKRLQTPRLLPVQPRLTMDNVTGALLNGATIDARLVNAISGMAATPTIDGPNLLTMVVEDSERELLNSAILDQQIVLDLDDLGKWVFDLAGDIGGYSVGDDTTTLKFWDITSGGLRDRDGYLSRSSKKMDLGGWTRLLARDALKGDLLDGEKLRVVVPDPGEVPQVVTSTTTTRTKAKTKTGLGGSASAMAKVTVKHVRADAGQRKNIDTILKVGVDLKVSWNAAVASICAPTQETVLRNDPNPSADGYGSRGVWQITAANARANNWPQMDVAWGARHFHQKGFAGRGGAIALARQGNSPGRIARLVENPGSPDRPYAQWESEAARTVQLWSGMDRDEWNRTVAQGKAKSSSSSSTAATKREVARPATWTRGTSKTPESSWTALGRQAEALGRRRFVTPFTRTPRLVIAADQQLILAQPHTTIVFDDDLLLETPTIDVEGAGHLEELTMKVIASGWAAPPGAVIDLQQAGPADGPWIVKDLGLDISTPDEISVTLAQPTTTVPTPPSSTKSKSKKSSSSPRRSSAKGQSLVDRVYSAGHKMSSSGVPYGHSAHGLPWSRAEKAGSQDCSSSTSVVLHAAGLMRGVSGPQVSDWFLSWGLPGRGKEMTIWVKRGTGQAGHVFVEFHGRTTKHFNTSQGFKGQGPRMRNSSPFTSGFVPRHWANT